MPPKLRALLVTHGHEDHIGGIPYFLREFPQTPIVGTPLSLALIKAKSRDQRLGETEFTQVQPGNRVRYGSDRGRVRTRQPLGGGCLRAGSAHAGRYDLSHRRLQVRSDADRRTPGRLRAASRGSATRACSACSRTRPTPSAPGHTLSERIVGEAFTSIFLSRQRPDRHRVVCLERSAHSAGRRPRRALRPQDRVPGPLDAQRRPLRQRAGASAHSAGDRSEDRRHRQLSARADRSW